MADKQITWEQRLSVAAVTREKAAIHKAHPNATTSELIAMAEAHRERGDFWGLAREQACAQLAAERHAKADPNDADRSRGGRS